MARKLKLLKRKQNDGKALKELDTALRKMDPEDPVKFDYALFGLGVFEKFLRHSKIPVQKRRSFCIFAPIGKRKRYMKILLKNATIIDPKGAFHLQEVDVYINEGKIDSIGTNLDYEADITGQKRQPSPLNGVV